MRVSINYNYRVACHCGGASEQWQVQPCQIGFGQNSIWKIGGSAVQVCSVVSFDMKPSSMLTLSI